jgi:hypothetical protein
VLTGTLDRDPGQDVGFYEITQGTLSANSNYTIDFTGNTLEITEATLIITADDQSKTFGDTFVFDGTEFSVTGLVPGDSVTSVTLTSDGAPAGAAAGPHAIVPSDAVGTGLGNYNIEYVHGTMTVAYAFGGLLEPFVEGRVYKAGSTIPIRWQYTDASGNVIDSSAAAPVVQVQVFSSAVCAAGDPVDLTFVAIENPGNSSMSYNADTSTWHVNWKTLKVAGCYVMKISGQDVEDSALIFFALK